MAKRKEDILFSETYTLVKLTKLLLIRRIPNIISKVKKKTSDDGFLDLNIKFDEKLSNITDQIDFLLQKKSKIK